MRPLRFMLLLMTFCGTASADITCREEGTQMEVDRCAQDRYERSKADLDNELGRLELLLEKQPRELELLRRSQAAWIEHVNAELALRFPSPEGQKPERYFGSMYWSEYYSARAEHLLRRIADLRQIRQMMPNWLEMRDVVDDVSSQLDSQRASNEAPL